VNVRFSRLAAACVLIAGLAASTAVIAQEAPQSRRLARHRFPLCLMVLDLTPEQRTDVAAILQAAWPQFRTDLAAVATARETLRTALDAEPADACTVGSATLDVDAALEALRAHGNAVKEQIGALLTPEQKARFEGCLDAPWTNDLRESGSIDEILR
jgi:Spy/CpxP family protein refolding chaperone